MGTSPLLNGTWAVVGGLGLSSVIGLLLHKMECVAWE